MKFVVDAWEPDYGVSADALTLTPAEEPVDPNVEVDQADWAPIQPQPASMPSSILFVDGVRRIDARIWATEGDVSKLGACATVAAGAVRCDGRASVVAAAIERAVYTPGGGGGPIVTAAAGTYHHRPLAEEGPEAVNFAVHQHMTELETTLALPQSPSELVVFDGPLRGRTEGSVGYVKTQAVDYLPAELRAVIGKLEPGQRTPLFVIGGRFTRWSCYVRLPGPRTHALSGVVRLELGGIGTVVEAQARLDSVTVVLPGFASQPHKDARAPQNLYPIAGLERELRRRLGDQRFLQRQLRRAAVG